MSKQTAVEWLVEQLKEYDFGTDDECYVIKMPSWILTEKEEQALQMEKEQIENAFQDGKWDWAEHITNGTESKDLTQYYNETYGGNK
jgi:hypothetical protein